ncbi:MAG: HD domain-containing protein [Acidobacteriia bacterium]|nr:HD domain-containing protein [Terriglobia bacterium]
MKGKLLRDAAHGDIELEPLEVELVDTPEFQRLRGIKQLGTAYLVYPSATHTRFEHSLGTSWMARRMIEALRRTGSISPDEATAICVAALLHDVTHIPFGHTLEDERRVLPRHDKDETRFAHFLLESSLAKRLQTSGYQDQVLRILRGEAGFASEIITGAITADLLDYLRRDTYFVGFSQYYDPRVFQSFILDRGRFVVNLEKHGMLRRDALSELVNLLRIRYTLSERVYFHHTKIASGAMISKAVELAISSGLQLKEMHKLKDETLIWILRERNGTNPAIAHILNCLESRQLYRACFVLTVDVGEDRQKEIVDRYHFSPADREQLEARIAGAAGLEAHQVIVYCPSIGMSLPEAEVLVGLENGRIVPLAGSNNEEIRVLKQKHKALWKFFVFIDRGAWDRREPARSAAAELLS